MSHVWPLQCRTWRPRRRRRCEPATNICHRSTARTKTQIVIHGPVSRLQAAAAHCVRRMFPVAATRPADCRAASSPSAAESRPASKGPEVQTRSDAMRRLPDPRCHAHLSGHLPEDEYQAALPRLCYLRNSGPLRNLVHHVRQKNQSLPADPSETSPGHPAFRQPASA